MCKYIQKFMRNDFSLEKIFYSPTTPKRGMAYNSLKKRNFFSSSASFTKEEILLLANKDKIFCKEDILSLFPGEEKGEIREEYYRKLSFPPSPSISLKGEILLSLENYIYDFSPSLFILEMGINVMRFIPKFNNKLGEYALVRDIFNFPPLKKEDI